MISRLRVGEDLVEFADIENASVEAREKYEKLDKLVTTPRYTVRYDEETKKPKSVRKKKTDTEESNTEEEKPVEKKKGAPRKKKSDTP